MTEQRRKNAKAPATYSDTIIKVVSGAMRGTEIPVKAERFTLGRTSDADIQIHDSMISRAHCLLEWENKRWFISDLDSTNGTWMVGRKVDKRSPLPLKTSVRIGNTIIELIDAYASDTQSFNRPFVAYSIQPETLALSRPGADQEDGSPGRAPSLRLLREESQHLSAIYKFQNMIASVLDEKKLYPRILNALMDVIATDKAYLLLYDLETGAFLPVGGRDESGMIEKINPKDISSAVIDFVRENKESVLSIDDSPEKRQFQEMVGMPNVVTSIMCVPMLGKRQLNGMVYLSVTSTTQKYTEDDLRLLTVIGHIAGMAIENSRLVEFNLKNERLVATGATAAGLSHYIKNILAGLDGSLNLLQMGIEEKDFEITSEAARILNKNHRRLSNLVLDLLNLASEQQPELAIHDLNAIINDVVELVEPQLRQEKISVKVDTSVKNTPFYVELDAKGIHRVLLNLISNSEQAILAKRDSTGEESGHILVTSKFNDKGDLAIVAVSDDGIGLDKKELDSMFDLFVTSKGSIGTGLGLAVSKRIVTAHEGNIYASSEKGEGCTVAFSLPVSHSEMSTVTRTIAKIR